jgi:succinoglycan biosynthesis transport protein ExoP
MSENNNHPSGTDSRSSLGKRLLNEKNWLDYLWIIREHWILALLTASLLAGFWVYKQSQTVPLFKSVALLLFEVQEDRVLNIQQVRDNSLGRAAEYILRNHLVDLKSNSFRSQVVESLSPEEKELIIKDYRTEDQEEDPNPHGIIAGANNIHQISGNIFAFEFQHRNPQAAALLANRYSEEFRDFLMERSRKSNESAIRFLRSQSEELKLKVERSELAVQRYRQERNLVSLEESQNLIVERMKSLSGSLNRARIELLNLSASLEQIEKTGGDLDEIARLPSINQMGRLPSLFERRSSLIAEREGLSIRYGSRHPRMIENQTALQSLEAEISNTLGKNVSDFRQQHVNMSAQVAGLEQALKEAEQEALELDQIAIEYNVLRRKLETDKALFTQVHQRLNEAVLASQLTDVNIRVVDAAWPASQPFTPDTKKTITLAVLIFLFSFAGVPYSIHYLNLNLKTAVDIEQQLGLPFLGEIRKFPRRLKNLHRLVLDQSDPQAAELFRQIHSQILLKTKKLNRGHTFIVTSAIPKEGKSFFAINLAASFSKHHYRTLLVDCDFRRPSIASRVKDLLPDLAGQDLSDTVATQVEENFYILGGGNGTQEATELIGSQLFEEKIKTLQNQYDIVVIDTPPAGLFPDAAMIGNHANHLIFLTQLNKHRKALLKGIINRLEEGNAEILGVVVNKVSRSKTRNLGAYRYADYSKYKNYYPVKTKKPEAAAQTT